MLTLKFGTCKDLQNHPKDGNMYAAIFMPIYAIGSVPFWGLDCIPCPRLENWDWSRSMEGESVDFYG